MSQQNTQNNKTLNTILGIVGVILIIWGVNYLLNNNDTSVPDESKQEQVGEFNYTNLRDFDGNSILDEDGNEQERG